MNLTRREALAAMSAAALPDSGMLRRHDESVERYLERQAANGGIPDDVGLYPPGSAAGLIDACTAAFLHPGSKFHKSPLMIERIRRASAFLDRVQHPDGRIDLLITNFDSTPDTGFVVQPLATAVVIARAKGVREIPAALEPFLRKAGGALATGGVHTPNHRWVVSSALAQLHELFPEPAYLRRIDQWLAEGIDIDADGQYTERSTGVYNPIVDRALVVMAAKLKRPELLDPVRRNLDSMLYLIHPGYEVVTGISHRQDQNQRADMGGYWFPLQYLAIRDGNGRYAAIAEHFAPQRASLSTLLEYPELAGPLPAATAIPTDYEKSFPALGVVRIRRGETSATLGPGDRFFTLRRGAAVVNAVRFASAFFGKGQFIPAAPERATDGYLFRQSLAGPYYQPLDPPHRVAAGEWASTMRARRQSEVCKLEQSATVTEIPGGFRLRIQSRGTDRVPVAVEISFRPGGRLEPQLYRVGNDAIRFGPLLNEHRYTQIRGALPKLEGESVYLCGFTPFDHSITFQVT